MPVTDDLVLEGLACAVCGAPLGDEDGSGGYARTCEACEADPDDVHWRSLLVSDEDDL